MHHYFAKPKFEQQYGRYWYMAINRLGRTQPIFEVGSPLVEQPYLAIFDRHERHDPKRNTQWWHLQLFKYWADELGLKLVVISDSYPRSLADGVFRCHSSHRDMALMANLVSYSPHFLRV